MRLHNDADEVLYLCVIVVVVVVVTRWWTSLIDEQHRRWRLLLMRLQLQLLTLCLVVHSLLLCVATQFDHCTYARHTQIVINCVHHTGSISILTVGLSGTNARAVEHMNRGCD